MAVTGRATAAGAGVKTWNWTGDAACPVLGVHYRGVCSGRGVQWMGVVSYSKAAYNII